MHKIYDRKEETMNVSRSVQQEPVCVQQHSGNESHQTYASIVKYTISLMLGEKWSEDHGDLFLNVSLDFISCLLLVELVIITILVFLNNRVKRMLKDLNDFVLALQIKFPRMKDDIESSTLKVAKRLVKYRKSKSVNTVVVKKVTESSVFDCPEFEMETNL